MVPAPTRRLRFREMGDADLDRMAGLLGDPEVMQYYPAPRTRDEALGWIRWNQRNYAEHGYGLWIVETHDGAFVGDCGPTWQPLDGAQVLEVGYHVVPAQQGCGYASEAARACLELALGPIGEARVVAIINADNAPSRRVATKIGLGDERYAEVRGVPVGVHEQARPSPGERNGMADMPPPSYGRNVLVAAYPPRRLGVPVDEARLHLGRDSTSPAAAFRSRYLYLADEPAFELSFWCGTCPFLFERQVGANGTLSAALGVMAELEGRLDIVDDQVLAPFATLLPEGEFLPLLLEVRPELVAPHGERDYFSHEQVATWGIDRFWGLPENPRSFYYRTYETAVSTEAHLYEFVVPLVPPSWNDRARVGNYRSAMAEGVVPTAVALSTLDVCQPATGEESADYHAHWGLTHFLLDGHHKLEAAARSGAPVRLLALVSRSGSLASAGDLARLPELLSRQRSPRASA